MSLLKEKDSREMNCQRGYRMMHINTMRRITPTMTRMYLTPTFPRDLLKILYVQELV